MSDAPANPLDVTGCTVCPMLGKDWVSASGNPGARLMIVSESPTPAEIKYGHWCGKWSEYMDWMLDEAELERDDVWFSHLVKCVLPRRQPLPGEIENCWREWLHGEIQLIDPPLILTFGRLAFEQIAPPGTKYGHLERHETMGRKLLTSYAPTWFRRRFDIAGFVAIGRHVHEILSGGDDGAG